MSSFPATFCLLGIVTNFENHLHIARARQLFASVADALAIHFNLRTSNQLINVISDIKIFRPISFIKNSFFLKIYNYLFILIVIIVLFFFIQRVLINYLSFSKMTHGLSYFKQLTTIINKAVLLNLLINYLLKFIIGQM
jgi:hypothetical protein